jgi:plastocyanin
MPTSAARGAPGAARALLLAVALCATLLCGCTGAGPAAPKPPAAQTVTVNVDGTGTAPPGSFTAYFPAQVAVHPGDTVTFALQDTGEPHTVTLGTLADAAVTAAGSPPNVQGPPSPEDAKLPRLLPSGAADANQAAAQPCFLASGDAPLEAPCAPAAQSPQPPFDGTQTFYNSGWLAAGQPFSVQLTKTIRPGTYQYFCLLHRAGMSGKVTVVDPTTPVPNPAAQAAQGAQQLQQIAAALQPAVAPLAQGKNPELTYLPSGPRIVLAGSGLQAVTGGLINAYGPERVSIPVGGTVIWLVLGDHTISFNPPPDASGLRVPNSTHLNSRATSAAGGPGPPPQYGGTSPPASGPPPPPRIVNGGAFDGTTFRSSGAFVSYPPAVDGYKVSFTRSGTYAYACLIHPMMRGTVVVG